MDLTGPGLKWIITPCEHRVSGLVSTVKSIWALVQRTEGRGQSKGDHLPLREGSDLQSIFKIHLKAKFHQHGRVDQEWTELSKQNYSSEDEIGQS